MAFNISSNCVFPDEDVAFPLFREVGEAAPA
jgi:hypothetical protein